MKDICKIWLSKPLFLCILSVILNQCNLQNIDEEEEKDLIEQSEEILTAHNWKQTMVHYLRAATETYPEPLDETVFMSEMDECLQDDYWHFNMEYEYEVNNGSIKCLADEETIGDWGDWCFDDSYENSSYLILLVSSWNQDLPDADYEYEVIELTTGKLIIRRGGCNENTESDEDGMCITKTFETY